MLVEFQRSPRPRANSELGEDDGIVAAEALPPRPIRINPQYVAAVFESLESPEVTMVRLCDGRGFAIKGSYSDVIEQLEGGGSRLQ